MRIADAVETLGFFLPHVDTAGPEDVDDNRRTKDHRAVCNDDN